MPMATPKTKRASNGFSLLFFRVYRNFICLHHVRAISGVISLRIPHKNERVYDDIHKVEFKGGYAKAKAYKTTQGGIENERCYCALKLSVNENIFCSTCK